MAAPINARGPALATAIVQGVCRIIMEVQRKIDKRCAINNEMLRGLAIWQVLRSILLFFYILYAKNAESHIF